MIARLRRRLLSEANVIGAGMLYHSLTRAFQRAIDEVRTLPENSAVQSRVLTS